MTKGRVKLDQKELSRNAFAKFVFALRFVCFLLFAPTLGTIFFSEADERLLFSRYTYHVYSLFYLLKFSPADFTT